MTPKTFVFKKNIKGTLFIDLETYDMMGVPKTFVFGPSIDQLVIPYPYALGLFVSQSAMNQYKLGCFTIEREDELFKAAVEQGFVAAEEKPEIARLVEVENIIKNNKVSKLRELVKRAENDVLLVNNILSCAREHFDTLSNEMVDIIQQAAGVDLRIE